MLGLLGATLEGGVGRYNGLHGLMLDSLLNVRVVTAGGDIIEASTSENVDLLCLPLPHLQKLLAFKLCGSTKVDTCASTLKAWRAGGR